MLPDCVEIATAPKPEAAVIWLHGLGADGHDFEPLVPALHSFLPCAVRFVFPHAPVRAVTINSGMPMRAWYDIVAFDRHAPQDLAGIRQSAAAIQALIGRETARGIDTSRIILAGFSQGGAMILHTGVRLAAPVAGLLALSCYLLESARLAECQPPSARAPVFLAHGEADEVLPLAYGEQARDALLAAGYQVEWHRYRVGHGVAPEEIDDIGRWLRRRLARAERPQARSH